MAGLPAAVQAAAASAMVLLALGGVAYRFVLKPIKETAAEAATTAEDAMSRANTATQRASDAEETAEDVADRVDHKLDAIDQSLATIQESLAEQAREARGRSYTLHRLTEAIRESDDIDADKLPAIDEDDFLRGGSNGHRTPEDDD